MEPSPSDAFESSSVSWASSGCLIPADAPALSTAGFRQLLVNLIKKSDTRYAGAYRDMEDFRLKGGLLSLASEDVTEIASPQDRGEHPEHRPDSRAPDQAQEAARVRWRHQQ